MDQATPTADTPNVQQGQERLAGRLGATSVVFSVLAFNAPLGVMAGFVPLVISVGNQKGAPVTFLVVMGVLLVFSVGLTKMAQFMHSPGAFYSYIVSGLGRVPGLGGAFLAFLAYAAFAICSYAFGGLATNALVTNVFHGPDLPWWLWSVVMWIVATVLSMLNIGLSARVLGVAMVAEIVVVLVWSLKVFSTGGPAGIPVAAFTLPAFQSGSVSVALLFGFLCITGFEACAVFREETKDPVKTIPRATYASVLFMCLFYALGAFAYLTAFGDDAVTAAADPSGSFTQSVELYLGTAAKNVVAVLLVTSIFASILANHNIGARYFYTLGSDGVLPPSLGRVHPRQGSPYVAAAAFAALALAGIIVSALAGFAPLVIYANLAAIGSVCLLALMTATSVSIVRFFRIDSTHTANVWQAVVAPATASIALGVVLYLAVTHLADITGGSTSTSAIALAVIIGVAVAGCGLAWFYRMRRPETYLRIGRQDL